MLYGKNSEDFKANPSQLCTHLGLRTGFWLLLVATLIAQNSLGDKLPSNPVLEEMTVHGELIPSSGLDLMEMQRISRKKYLARLDFKKGRYEEAFPKLLELAKYGMKDSQARVAFIYLHGLGGVQKSNVKALAWLGTASLPDTRPQYRHLFKKLMAEVPPQYKVLVSNKVDEFRQRYGAKSRGVDCTLDGLNRNMTFTCRFKDEMARQFQEDAQLYDRILDLD